MTGLYIAMIAAAVIGFVLIIPIKAVISFALSSDENEMTIRYLFFKLNIYPASPKQKTEEQGGEEFPKKDKSGFAGSVWVSRSEIKWGLSKLLCYIIKHAITIRELNISARFGFSNPMNTGLAAGAANAAVYNVIGLLDRHARLKKWSVELKPDFDGQCLMAGVYCRLHMRAAHIFPLAAVLLRTYMKIKKKTRKNGGKKNEQSN